MAIYIPIAVIILLIPLAALLCFRFRFYAWWIGFPQPVYQVKVDRDIMVPTHDGLGLATDIYRPKAAGKYPVIIARTPYNKTDHVTHYHDLARLFAGQGYVFLLQDVRGKHNSEGIFEPYVNESIDGHTTIDWAGKAPWSNGKVALFGFSYLGSCVWLAAKYRSPFLKAIIPMFTTQNTYSVWIDKGVLFLKGNVYWLTKYYKKRDSTVTNDQIEPVLWKLPVGELDVLTVNHKIKAYRDFLEHMTPDDFWERRSVHQDVENLDMPAFIVGGWFDPFLTGTIEDFHRMANSPPNSKNRQSRLLLGPWAHNPVQSFKGVNFGKKAYFPRQLTACLKWCDTWLKDEAPAQPDTPKVKYFVMGKNEWKEAEEWPPKAVQYEKYYLNAEEERLPKKNRFHLSKELTLCASQTKYTYDPRNPVPFRGSQLLHQHTWTGPIEQTEIIARNDVITFRSAPLQEEITIAGPVKLVIFISSTAVDTDFCAKICDERPDGTSYGIQTGILRTRYRESLKEPKLMIPGTIYRLEIFLRATAHAFLKKHRIQLQITSSNFPAYDRNLNTGKSCEHTTQMIIAQQTLYTGGAYDSHLLLPVLPV